ncbi:MAG TPA: hypothetical protein ENK49_05135 [Gammaproteobacteria bacterium]|nr:hypothetical protein [Gammaproteobacteria bacterium]
MNLLPVSMFLAFVVGFSAHRAGVCTVAAVAELRSTRQARLFISFLKTILWILLISKLLLLWHPELARPWQVDSGIWLALAGGFIFGVGATVNGGCGFSTISKLAQGNLHLAFTLPAFMAGVKTALYTLPASAPTGLATLVLPFTLNQVARWLLFAALVAWAVRELILILAPVIKSRRLLPSLFANRYRLSTGAALIGISGGLLYAINGKWAYSSLLVQTVTGRNSSHSVSPDIAVYLFIALLAGAVFSAVSGRRFRFSFAGDQWTRNLAGGFLMGFGAMMVPGGNSALILQGLPQLSLHAITAYPAMVLGILITMRIIEQYTGKALYVSCSRDQCRVEKPEAESNIP